jgi:hypothetical protein
MSFLANTNIDGVDKVVFFSVSEEEINIRLMDSDVQFDPLFKYYYYLDHKVKKIYRSKDNSVVCTLPPDVHPIFSHGILITPHFRRDNVKRENPEIEEIEVTIDKNYVSQPHAMFESLIYSFTEDEEVFHRMVNLENGKLLSLKVSLDEPEVRDAGYMIDATECWHFWTGSKWTLLPSEEISDFTDVTQEYIYSNGWKILFDDFTKALKVKGDIFEQQNISHYVSNGDRIYDLKKRESFDNYVGNIMNILSGGYHYIEYDEDNQIVIIRDLETSEIYIEFESPYPLTELRTYNN